MNELQIFNSEEFGQVRTVLIDNEPYFVGKDVAAALGYINPQDALKNHIDSEDKKMGEPNATPYIIDSLGRKQYPTYINESGLYSLVFGSKLETAKKFKHWVTSEVLPTLRKTGSYEMPKKQPEKKKKNLSAANMLVKTVSGIFKDAGVDPMFIAAEYELWYTGRKYKGGYGYEKVFNWSLWDVFGRLFGWGQYFTGAVRKCSGRKRSV